MQNDASAALLRPALCKKMKGIHKYPLETIAREDDHTTSLTALGSKVMDYGCTTDQRDRQNPENDAGGGTG